MIQMICTKKYRNSQGKIISYKLENSNGEIMNMNSDILKKNIKEKKLNVKNLKLTSDNRLIDNKDINEYAIYNKDKKIASFNKEIGNLIIYDKLPYGFSTLATWIEGRYKFSCARDTINFFKSIGINDPLDFIEIIHCVSLHDTFWVKRIEDNIKWKDVSPYTHSYSKIISIYALDGILIKDKSRNYFSPVVETDGTFPHTWIWKDNEIYFVKAGSKYTMPASNSGREPYSEYYASVIAEYLNFNSVKYSIRYHNRHDGKIDEVTECKIFTNEEKGTVTANNLGLLNYEDVIEYCKSLSKESYDTILNMLFLDCLLLNTDRHFSNIEFFVNNENQQIIEIAPIFDNNFSMLPRFIEGYDKFNRSDYIVRDNRTFEELYELIKKHKKYTKELIKLKKLKLKKPKNVDITNKRLKFLNKFLQMQVDYLISLN